jgi:hypothetical protein
LDVLLIRQHLIMRKTGNLKNMKWLYSNGCNYNLNTFRYAIQSGSLEVIKWLLSIDCKKYKYAIEMSDTYEYLEIIK